MDPKADRPLILSAFEQGQCEQSDSSQEELSPRSLGVQLWPQRGLELGGTSAHPLLLLAPLPGGCPVPGRPDLLRKQRRSGGPASCDPARKCPDRGLCAC